MCLKGALSVPHQYFEHASQVLKSVPHRYCRPLQVCLTGTEGVPHQYYCRCALQIQDIVMGTAHTFVIEEKLRNNFSSVTIVDMFQVPHEETQDI